QVLSRRGISSRTARNNEILCRVDRHAVRDLFTLLSGTFGAELLLMVGNDRREDRGGFEIHYLFAHPRENWWVDAAVAVPGKNPSIDSLGIICYPASRFEREIFDLFGVVPTGHPDPRPLVRHGFWPQDYFPLRKDARAEKFADDGRPFPFQEVGGEGVYEIPVGPVHAGVIEPGHFRFSVVGETIIDMKARFYFTHKGTEKLFEERTPLEAVELAERISGDTTVGHTLAFCQAIESLSGVAVPPRARYLRVVLLELERLYNHVGDFGMIANDTGFAFAHAHCFRIRERLLRLNKKVSGSRLLRTSLIPGGVVRDMPRELDLAAEVESALADFEEVVQITLANRMVTDRLEGTGRLATSVARDQGVVGYVGRASGIDADVRRDHPFAAYGELEFKVPVLESGDVKARTLVRVEEARQSARLIRQALAGLPGGPLSAPVPALAPFEPAFSVVEGWRGAIVHWLMVDAAGKLYRVKVMDPSFRNWRSLSYALLKNIVPDFPLCNKSYNQSYSGNDL
ncbi:MAG TPA: NADH-quinone oxidoreductase subunit C, partial [Candidatus Binatia bacterium]